MKRGIVIDSFEGSVVRADRIPQEGDLDTLFGPRRVLRGYAYMAYVATSILASDELN